MAINEDKNIRRNFTLPKDLYEALQDTAEYLSRGSAVPIAVSNLIVEGAQMVVKSYDIPRNDKDVYYTTWSQTRGDCGHAHTSIDAAIMCVERDMARCTKQGGYSDRHVQAIKSQDDLQSYDVVRGPGKPIYR